MSEMEKTESSLVFNVVGYNGNHYRSLRHGTDPADFDYRVLVEGDSWANILYPWSDLFGYNEAFPNFIERDPRFYYKNVGWPGDTLDEIVASSTSPHGLAGVDTGIYQPIRSGIFDFMIFSGGGNDFLGGGELKKFLRRYRSGTTDPWECLDEDKVDEVFTRVKKQYRRLIKLVNVSSKKTQILLHGYDHAVPRSGGRWLGTPFSAKGYTPEARICSDIIAVLVDRMYDMLGEIAATNKMVHVVDVRGSCLNNWHDELHPNRPAAKEIAERFISRMVAASRRAARTLPRAVGGENVPDGPRSVEHGRRLPALRNADRISGSDGSGNGGTAGRLPAREILVDRLARSIGVWETNRGGTSRGHRSPSSILWRASTPAWRRSSRRRCPTRLMLWPDFPTCGTSPNRH